MFLRMFTLALSLCALAPPASAADYPDHAIKMIVPFAAGGGTECAFSSLMTSLTCEPLSPRSSACSSVHTNRAICVGEADRQTTSVFSPSAPLQQETSKRDAYG